uniref:Uncharacterized protein n=1 Tax=Dicentrarchus labrax TaxID=13489 RepID=A0A8P4JW57_DICLA
MVALEHIKELDKQLKEDGIPFSPEASLHLTEMTAAITELEADRRATHEHLEVETIENSKLRHQINSIRERMSQEIMADVAAARASNAEEIEQLHKDLRTVCQLQEDTVKRQEALLRENEALYPERERVRAEHVEIVATLNDQITFKYGLQMQLDWTQEQIEELRSCVAAVQQDKATLQQNMVLEREALAVKQGNLDREVDQVEGKIKQQKQVIRRDRGELDRVDDKKRETNDHLGKLTIDLAKLESNLRRLTASRCQCEKQLEGETQKHQELRQQRETLKKELCDLVEAFSRRDLELSIQRLKEKTVSLLQPKEEMKAELEEMRGSYMDTLDTQASELKAVELSIYDSSVKLEEVSMENSRLHLCIRQMTEAASRARVDKDRYQQETHQFKQDMKDLSENVQEAWREDLLLTQDCQSSDGVLLEAMSGMLSHLKTRRQQLGHVGTLLHQQMLDFSNSISLQKLRLQKY